MFKWNEESILWYRRASAANTFFSEVAEDIKGFVDRDDSVCDLGCGIGGLSLEMAKHAGRVTAVDIEERVLQVLKSDVERGGLKNIDILHSDWRALSGKTWDTVAVCNFGDIPPEIPLFMDLCEKRCILILRVNNSYNVRKLDIPAIQAYLEAQAYSYTLMQRQTEFGQLFVSQEEASRFFTHYGQMPVAEGARFMHDNLAPSGVAEYPLYYPCLCTTSIFVIEKNTARVQ